MSDRKALILAGVMLATLLIASAITLGLFGAGAWEYVTTDFFPAKTPSTADRWAGVTVCLIPIVLVFIIWVQLAIMVRIVRTRSTAEEPPSE